MVKGSYPCGWFVGGWGRIYLVAILPASGVVPDPTSLSEFRNSFERPRFSVESLPALCGWSVSNRGRGRCTWFVGVRCFRGGFPW